jgi:two-component system, chemotaxis family, protein-glutamate methylesterase/glutaminase
VTPEIVMIGVSAGGLDALCTLLGGLEPDLTPALVLVQHRSKDSNALCEVLQRCTALPLHEVLDKATIQPGHVYLAPPDYHLLVEEGFFSLSTDAPQLFSRPSIDVAFESAAESYRERVVGVVLTGANHDGARGLREIGARGGRTLVQDPATAEVPVMPAAAIRAVPDAEVHTLQGIAECLNAYRRAARPAAEER